MTGAVFEVSYTLDAETSCGRVLWVLNFRVIGGRPSRTVLTKMPEGAVDPFAVGSLDGHILRSRTHNACHGNIANNTGRAGNRGRLKMGFGALTNGSPAPL